MGTGDPKHVSARQPPHTESPRHRAAHPCRRLAVPSVKCGSGYRLKRPDRMNNAGEEADRQMGTAGSYQ